MRCTPAYAYACALHAGAYVYAAPTLYAGVMRVEGATYNAVAVRVTVGMAPLHLAASSVRLVRADSASSRCRGGARTPRPAGAAPRTACDSASAAPPRASGIRLRGTAR